MKLGDVLYPYFVGAVCWTIGRLQSAEFRTWLRLRLRRRELGLPARGERWEADMRSRMNRSR